MLRLTLTACLFLFACHSDSKTTAPAPDKIQSADPPAPHDGPALQYGQGEVPANNALLIVSTSDDMAVIAVDGETRGTTPRDADNPIRVTAGAHRVQLRYLPSGPTKLFTIQVAPNETYKLIEPK